MKRIPAISLTAALLLCSVALHAAKPKLIVEIVISQMRYEYLSKFHDNFSEDGFRMLMREGTSFSNAGYNYMLTNTVAGLGTISTGSNPSTHGVSCESWIDMITSRRVNLVQDDNVRGLGCDDGLGRYSPSNLITGTLGDALKKSDPLSKVISIAPSPASAIVFGGRSADTYWLDAGRGTWISSNYYCSILPEWILKWNKSGYSQSLLREEWTMSRHALNYKNTSSTVLKDRSGDSYFAKLIKPLADKLEKKSFDYMRLLYTPAGNSMVSSVAREAIIYEDLGKDEHTDLLTICYDTPRYISESFGPESMELEDMYYRLDKEIADLANFIFSQIPKQDVLIVLTSDHGSSDSQTGENKSRGNMGGLFSTDQFVVITNSFLSAQYEPGNWVVDYNDRQLYLNRTLIYKYGFNLEEVQNKVASFALQFRGVSHAVTATALQSNYFGGGYGAKIQNSYYPKRGGDVTINLMPGWIEEVANKRSLSGSQYRYDTHVPLIFTGFNVPKGQVVERDVDMTGLAPTLARIMRSSSPDAATGIEIKEVVIAE